MAFSVGQKVVCVDPTWGATGEFQRWRCPNLPVRGVHYTIRSTELILADAYGPAREFVRLEEVVNPESPEPVFEGFKYRPLRTTDIFTALLAPSPSKAKRRERA